MADSRGFKPINQLWQSATVSTDQDSECLYEEIPGLAGSQDTDQPTGAAVGQEAQGEEEEEEEEENVVGSRGSLDFGAQVGGSSGWWSRELDQEIVAGGGTVPRVRARSRSGRSEDRGASGGGGGARSRAGSADRRPSASQRTRQLDTVGRVEEEQYVARRIHVESSTGAVLPPPAATGLKLTRGRASSQQSTASNTVARYLHSASTNVAASHYHHHHHGLHGQYPPGSRTTGRQHRHHHPSRGSFSNETQEEVQEDDEATLRELLVRYVAGARVSSWTMTITTTTATMTKMTATMTSLSHTLLLPALWSYPVGVTPRRVSYPVAVIIGDNFRATLRPGNVVVVEVLLLSR